MSLEKEERDHADSSMVTGREDKFVFHVSIESAGGKKGADGWALDCVQCFGLEVGGAEGVSDTGEVVDLVGNSGAGRADRVAEDCFCVVFAFLCQACGLSGLG